MTDKQEESAVVSHRHVHNNTREMIPLTFFDGHLTLGNSPAREMALYWSHDMGK